MRPRLHPELPLISAPVAASEATDALGDDVEVRRARIRGAIAGFYKAQRLKRGVRR